MSLVGLYMLDLILKLFATTKAQAGITWKLYLHTTEAIQK